MVNEIGYITKLANATVIGLSKTKLGNTVLSREHEVEGYYLVRFDQSQRGGMVCFVKNSISYNWKPNCCINTESVFIEIFLTRSKPVLIDILYRPDKYKFVNFLERLSNDTNATESQECYLLGGININLQLRIKTFLEINSQILLIKRYLT